MELKYDATNSDRMATEFALGDAKYGTIYVVANGSNLRMQD